MATRASIRSYARIRADQTNSTFPTDAECDILIDAAARRTWRKLVVAGWLPRRGNTSFTANGATFYDTDTGAVSVYQVYRVDGTILTPLPRVKPEELATYASMGNGPAQVYDLVEGVVGVLRITFYPKPTSGTYQVLYNTRFPGFAADADVWYGPDGSEDLIGLEAAIMMKKKEGLDTRDLMDEYVELYQEVCYNAGILDAIHPGTVRDVHAVGSQDPFDWGASEGWV